jgi:hypothetical protein
MLKQMAWKPDTCGCEIILDWDDSLPAVEHIFNMFKYRCEAHLNDEFNSVLEENRLKNLVFTEINKIIPTITPELYQWKFDENRKLVIEYDTSEIRSAIDTKFGPDKVKWQNPL